MDQTFSHFELLILDDNSDDDTAEVVRSFKDKRITLFQNKINVGAAAVRNGLIELANCDYLAFLDADDFSMPERLERQYRFLQNNPEYVIVGSSGVVINEAGDHVSELTYKYEHHIYPPLLFFHNIISQSSIMLNGKYLEGMDYVYDESLPPAEDYDLWIRLSIRGQIYNLRDKLTAYRLHDQGISQRRADKMRESVDHILERNLTKLEIVCNERQMDIHRSFTSHELIQSKGLRYFEFLDWFTLLVHQNTALEVYNNRYFVKVITLKWSEIVTHYTDHYQFKNLIEMWKLIPNPWVHYYFFLKLFVKICLRYMP